VVRRFANENALVASAARSATNDASLNRDEEQQIVERVDRALTSAVQSLSARHQLILKLRFDDELTIADIARLLKVPAKPLYRELEVTIADLREKLRHAGIDETDMDRVVGHPAVTLSRIFRTAGETDLGSV
jgi:DNA-directed RNA polymerase specialized sigma subunit